MTPAARVLPSCFIAVCLSAMSSPASTASELTDALKARDIVQVRSLIAAGVDVNEKVQGDFPLNIAALFGPAEFVKVLIAAGADVERSNRDGMRPLHSAVVVAQTEIVALLLQRGAAVNAKDKRGRTPLYSFACTTGKGIDIARMLLAAGADPKLEDNEYRETGLNCAVESGNLELAELLISTGIDVNHRNADGWSALHYAARHLRHDIARVLIAAGADVNLSNKRGKTPILEAPTDAAMRQLLTEAGAN